MNLNRRSSRPLFFLLGTLLIFLSCKEAEVYQKSGTVDIRNAGHYVEEAQGKRNRLSSVRYLLTPDGKAEQHTLERGSRWSDYQLQEIRRGRWYNSDSTLMVILESDKSSSKARDSIATAFDLQLVPSQRDSAAVDTLWAEQGPSNKYLRLISRF